MLEQICGIYRGYLECWNRFMEYKRVFRVLGQIVVYTQRVFRVLGQVSGVSSSQQYEANIS